MDGKKKGGIVSISLYKLTKALLFLLCITPVSLFPHPLAGKPDAVFKVKCRYQLLLEAFLDPSVQVRVLFSAFKHPMPCPLHIPYSFIIICSGV